LISNNTSLSFPGPAPSSEAMARGGSIWKFNLISGPVLLTLELAKPPVWTILI